jgi:hypothetical protein
MDYRKLSDAEINLAVAAIQFPQSEINTPYYHRPDAYIYHRNGTHEAKGYCNNAADAWPIITKSLIELVPNKSGEWQANSVCGEFRQPYQDKALRAAMIVFLMMQESE